MFFCDLGVLVDIIKNNKGRIIFIIYEILNFRVIVILILFRFNSDFEDIEEIGLGGFG